MRRRYVEHLIADRDADAERFAAASAPERAERQVLERKVGLHRIGRRKPTLQLRIVRLVECMGHGCPVKR